MTASIISDNNLVDPRHGLLDADVRGPAPGPAHVGLHPARAQHEEGEVGVLHRQAGSQHVLHSTVQYSAVQYSTAEPPGWQSA